MATLVTSWNSKIGHITDDPNGDTVKTRCGRILKTFIYGQGGVIGHDCERCGSPEEWEAVEEEMNQQYAAEQKARDEARQRTKERTERRLSTHRQLMEKLEGVLADAGANITDVRQMAAGGSIEFEMSGLTFKLGGNIW